MIPGEAMSSGEAQLLLGRLLLRKEDWNGAKDALDSAAAALPGLAEAQAALGTTAYNVGELKLAADAYGRAVALEPDNVAYLSNHGLFLGYDGRLDEGLAVLLKVAARPDAQGDAGTFINLGWLYRNLRPPKVAESVAAYEKARKLDPKSAKAALGVPLAYRAAGQWARPVSLDRWTTIRRCSACWRRPTSRQFGPHRPDAPNAQLVFRTTTCPVQRGHELPGVDSVAKR